MIFYADCKSGHHRGYRELLRDAEAVVISGSLPRGMEADVYVRMIQEAKRASVPVLLDTSGPALQECVRAAPVLIKPNQDEIRQLTPFPLRCIDIPKHGLPHPAAVFSPDTVCQLQHLTLPSES